MVSFYLQMMDLLLVVSRLQDAGGLFALFEVHLCWLRAVQVLKDIKEAFKVDKLICFIWIYFNCIL